MYYHEILAGISMCRMKQYDIGHQFSNITIIIIAIKLIIILLTYFQGVYARGLYGNASSSFTDKFKHVVRPLAKTGCSFFE